MSNMGHNVAERDHMRAVYEVTAANMSEVRRAIDALDSLGIDVSAEKDSFNEIREFMSAVAAVSKFKATELSVEDVLREAREDAPALDVIAARVAGIKLHDLRGGLRVHGEVACEAIDAARAELHARWEELAPQVRHFSAEDAIAHDAVDAWREFKSLGGQWNAVRSYEKCLLAVRAVPSERGRDAKPVRVGHNVWQRWTGQWDLSLEDEPAAVAYAEALEHLPADEHGTADGHNSRIFF